MKKSQAAGGRQTDRQAYGDRLTDRGAGREPDRVSWISSRMLSAESRLVEISADIAEQPTNQVPRTSITNKTPEIANRQVRFCLRRVGEVGGGLGLDGVKMGSVQRM